MTEKIEWSSLRRSCTRTMLSFLLLSCVARNVRSTGSYRSARHMIKTPSSSAFFTPRLLESFFAFEGTVGANA
eukprot:7379381-Prymnesium_polylepis.2